MGRRFTTLVSSAGISVAFELRRLMTWRVMPFSDWTTIDGPERATVACLLGLSRTGSATAQSDNRLLLTHDTAARLPQAVADEIGLPTIAPLSVTLSFEGRVEEHDSRIRARWYDANTRAIRIAREGIIVDWGTGTGRLSLPLFELAEAIDGFNSSIGRPIESRIVAWQPVQDVLHRTTGGEVQADRYLSSLTIYQAGSFALDVRETPNGPDFLPVLMSRTKAASLEDDAPVSESQAEGEDHRDPNVRDQTADALLPPDLQATFEKAHFGGAPRSRDAYVLARNTYLVLDPDLQLALDVVRRKRAAPVDHRRAFVRNPRPAIAEALSDAGRDTPAVGLFVETVQYSERVLGLGAWEPPQIPWLKKRVQQWLPECFPFAIGSRTLTLTPESFEELQRNYATASLSEAPTVELNGERFLTNEVGTALREFKALEGEPKADPQDTTSQIAELSLEAPHPSISEDDSQVLQIKTNIDGIEYQIENRTRPARIKSDLPVDLLGATAPKPHQLQGYSWLLSSWRAGWPGVLLADDMGLGKTYQALAFLAWLRKNRQSAAAGPALLKGPFLIVAPTALLRNWQVEARRHLAHGALGECVEAFGYGLSRLKRPRDLNWTPEDSLDVTRLRDADWILTTYETLADNHRAFARVAYSVAIFDEIQKIKTPGTINTHAAKAMNVDFVLGLTGTPIENRIEDLWCIMDRVAPGFLGDLRSFSAVHSKEDPDSLRILKAKMDEPCGSAPAVMLRRMKEDILEGLPPKSIEQYRVEMPPAQADAYAEAVAAARAGQRDRGSMLKAIHAFRGISLHPEGGADVNPYDRESLQSWISRSARLSQVVAILSTIRDRTEKAIVFVEDREVQKAFAIAATQLFKLSIDPAVINGQVPGPKRQAIVDKFQEGQPGFDILVLSPKAAGIGLTITAANHVIHLSRWWNPAVEDQCNDRVYRIGQERPVTIHIPIAVHPLFGASSFDETLNTLLEGKRALSRSMLAPPVRENDVDLLFDAAVGQ